MSIFKKTRMSLATQRFLSLAFMGMVLVSITNCGKPGATSGESKLRTTGFIKDVVMVEGAGATVNVVMSQGTASPLVYQWAIQGSQASSRFSATSGKFTVPANALSANFQLQSIDDAKYDLDKSYILVFTPDVSSSPALSNVNLKVSERLGRPSLSSSNVAIEGGQLGSVLFEINEPVAFDTEFFVQSSDGSAIAGRDYKTVSQKVVMPAGQKKVTVPLVTLRDGGLASLDRIFAVFVSQSSILNAGAGAKSEVLLFDRNRKASLNQLGISDAQGLEGDAIKVKVSLNQPSPFSVSVDYTMTDISARSGVDYNAQNGSLTIPAGQTSGFITVTALKDGVYEGQLEDLRINLTNPKDATLGNKTEALVRIEDIDALPVLNVISVTNGIEGGVASVELALSAKAAKDASFKWSTVAGTADAKDYTVVTDRMVTILAGQTSALLQIAITKDNLAEQEESFSITLSGLQNATTQKTSVPVKILSGSLPVVSVQVAKAQEGSEANMTLMLDRANSKQDIHVAWHTELYIGPNAATASDVFVGRGETVIPKGLLVAFAGVPIFEDKLNENGEIYKVVIDSVNGADRAQLEVLAQIQDNDRQPSLTTSVTSAVEGANAVLRAKLSEVSGRDVMITWSTANGTALAGQDYMGHANSVAVIPAGKLFVDIPVSTYADRLDEANETFIFQVSEVNGASVTPVEMRRTATIINTDPVISMAGSSVSEGGLLTFTIYLSFPSLEETSVVVETLDGTAAAPGDYQRIVPTRLTIPAGVMQKQIRVQTNRDALTEANETVRLKLSAPVRLNLPANAAIAVGTILAP